jgi:hypothetical protein
MSVRLHKKGRGEREPTIGYVLEQPEARRAGQSRRTLTRIFRMLNSRSALAGIAARGGHDCLRHPHRHQWCGQVAGTGRHIEEV